jgi:3-oxoacyl-[acyl-carrier protein] reductase
MGQDAGSSADAARVAEAIRDRFGSLDFLVTGAGIYREQLIEGMTDEQWRETLAVNLDGVFFTCRAAAPLLNEGGAVVNVASMSGHTGSYMHGHYAATKGAVLAFTRTLALELAPKVRVNAVSPGLIDTPMVGRLMDLQGDRLLDMTPLKRLGAPEEVGKVVAFLCSDWASFITAETIHINGGLYVSG